ncbi:N-terminal acetyltransferase A complex auxiliary subunit NAA15-like isoform X3 [Durio zibethinus]|uniref:N-terminal acetyltransferase A complex auxiliary subunit NAA15-like isoform X3 n=1 Tax=Durio zibethinus TaxID=66656 RepID=A0A6P6AIF4_DURZI|nr:N-terminal acetyltransferase A complex auxiliary subunit NAA15-like isoform X3 [Durio zibethinus]
MSILTIQKQMLLISQLCYIIKQFFFFFLWLYTYLNCNNSSCPGRRSEVQMLSHKLLTITDSLETHLLSFEAVKQLLRLDAENPDSHRCLIKFFHKLGSMPAPLTDAEKLVWSVLEAERPSISQLQEKTLSEANKVFLGKHEESLMHIVVVAEMLYTLEHTKKLEAVKLIEDSCNKVMPMNGALGPVLA